MREIKYQVKYPSNIRSGFFISTDFNEVEAKAKLYYGVFWRKHIKTL